MCVCLSKCVCVCLRACVRACVCMRARVCAVSPPSHGVQTTDTYRSTECCEPETADASRRGAGRKLPFFFVASAANVTMPVHVRVCLCVCVCVLLCITRPCLFATTHRSRPGCCRRSRPRGALGATPPGARPAHTHTNNSYGVEERERKQCKRGLCFLSDRPRHLAAGGHRRSPLSPPRYPLAS